MFKKPAFWVFMVLYITVGLVIGQFINAHLVKTEIKEFKEVVNAIYGLETRKTNFIQQYKSKIFEINPNLNDIDIVLILSSIFDNVERYQNLTPEIVLATIHQESQFRTNAISSSNAQGLMQILPSTGYLLSLALHRPEYNLKSIKDNIDFGCYYLSLCIQYYGEENGLASYYAGQNIEMGKNYAKQVLALKEKWK